jgi:hypothetical protein
MNMRRLSLILLLILLVSAGVSCRQTGRDLTGKYRAVPIPGDGKALELELKSDGKGSWKMGHEDFSFTWEDRGDEVWLHTRAGGVVAGRIGEDRSIHVSLPAVGSFRFEKLEP